MDSTRINALPVVNAGMDLVDVQNMNDLLPAGVV
jgi:hypothetical protein